MRVGNARAGQTTRIFWFAAMVFVLAATITAEQEDPAITAGGCIVALVAISPLYCWLLGWSRGLPIWPTFCMATGMAYALPMIQSPVVLQNYSTNEVLVGGITYIGFVLLGTAVWLSMTSRFPRPPKTLLMIEVSHSIRYLFLFVALGLAFGLNQLTGLIPMPGNSMQVLRGICGSLSTVGLFILAYYSGQGLLGKAATVAFVAGALATMLMNMTSLMLAQAAVPVAMVMLGYTLGSNRLPWKAMVVVLVAMSILHAGKFEMRKTYWGGEESAGKRLTLETVPAFYVEWFGFGLQELGGFSRVLSGGEGEEAHSSVFHRSGNLHMLLLVQKKSPQEVPYFFGATYAPIPRLLIPRFLDNEKGISHAGNVMLSVNYGVLAAENTNTSIGWGLLPEAYANFGAVGIAALALALAAFYSVITRLSVGVPMTSLRFVIGLLVMGAATTADTMGIFVTSQFQGIVGVVLASVVLMRRQHNPFASGISEEMGTIARSARAEHGMPAPGFLTSLIEGDLGSSHGGATGQVAPPALGSIRNDGRLPQGRTRTVSAVWMPRRMRRRLAAQREAEWQQAQTDASLESSKRPATGSPQSQRPRQVAVPIQPYYYRSRKA